MNHINNVNIYSTGIFKNSNTNTAGLNNTQNTGGQNSIWALDKSQNTTNNNNDEITTKIYDEATRIATTYDINPLKQTAQKAADRLNETSIQALGSVGTKLYSTIQTKSDEFYSLLKSIGNECKGITDPEELENKIKSIEKEIIKKRQEISTCSQRMQLAVQLDTKLSNLANDPEKAKLLKNVDMEKIAEKLLELPQTVNSEPESSDTEETGKLTKTKSDEGISGNENDEILNIISSIVKYAETGEKDKTAENYINNDKMQNSDDTTTGLFKFETGNPFGQTQKKNPFFT